METPLRSAATASAASPARKIYDPATSTSAPASTHPVRSPRRCRRRPGAAGPGTSRGARAASAGPRHHQVRLTAAARRDGQDIHHVHEPRVVQERRDGGDWRFGAGIYQHHTRLFNLQQRARLAASELAHDSNWKVNPLEQPSARSVSTTAEGSRHPTCTSKYASWQPPPQRFDGLRAPSTTARRSTPSNRRRYPRGASRRPRVKRRRPRTSPKCPASAASNDAETTPLRSSSLRSRIGRGSMRQRLERAEAVAVDAVVQGIKGLCRIGVGLDAPRRPDHGLDRVVTC